MKKTQLVNAKRRKLTDTRKNNLELILVVAEQRFAEYGYSGTTISAIADQANLPKSNILYYFKTKEALYKEVLSKLLLTWLTHMEEMSADKHPSECLRHYILQKIKQSKIHSNGSRIFAAEILHGAPYLREQLQTDLKDQFERTCQVIREWIAKQWMNPVSPEHLLFMIWSSTQAYADYGLQMSMMLEKTDLEDNDYEAGAELITRMVLKGCGIKLL
ncbi:TetR/AcrR family transcriptional regulator [Psychromonas sp. PT13]|uniref:TetR/AcrR family transcriptional regulator n=1 Tax=Psychromonas sp. PT13 TaxID=3439547 RepID=UPI003EB8E703